MISVLDESQDQRDLELSRLTGIDLDIIKSINIDDNSKIILYDGNKELTDKEDIEGIYASYGSGDNALTYIKKLMQSSIYNRHGELIDVIRKTRDKRCLEFGSGVATHSIALWQNDNDVAILDLPGPLIDFAGKRLENRGAKAEIYAYDSELPENSYDLVVCTDVLEHAYDPLQEIKRIYTAMKTGGVLCLHVALDESLIHGHFKQSIERWKNDGMAFVEKHFQRLGEISYQKIDVADEVLRASL